MDLRCAYDLTRMRNHGDVGTACRLFTYLVIISAGLQAGVD